MFVISKDAVGNCVAFKKSSESRCFSSDPMPWYDLSELISITNDPPVILLSVRVRDPLWRLNDPGCEAPTIFSPSHSTKLCWRLMFLDWVVGWDCVWVS